MKKITLLTMLMTFLMSLTLSAQETHVYSVAGTPKALFGSDDDWDPTFTGTEMTLNGNVYEWTSEQVELNIGKEVKFKVVEDHDWAVSYGLQGETGEAANMICTAENHGLYTLKVTFEPENDNLVTGELTLVEELPNTYTVVGAPAVLFAGQEWEPNNEAAIMQLGDNGLYVWTSEFGELTTEDNPYADQGPGHVECKVLVNHDWNVSYPGANCSVAIPANGKYSLKVTFDPETHAVSGELVPEPVETTYSVAGIPASLFGGEWDATNTATEMTLNEETNLYEWTSELTELTTTDGDPEEPGYVFLKVVENHDWNVSYPEEDNYDIVIPSDGKYTLKVTFNPETKEINGELILDDPNLITEIYMVGSFANAWQWDTPEGRLPLTYKDGAFEITQLVETGDEFKFIAPLVAEPTGYSDWKWYGGEDEAHVANFWVTDDFVHGTWPINMITHEGTEHNFLMCVTGEFTFRIISMANNDVTLRAPVGSAGVREPLTLIIDAPNTAITDVTADKTGTDIWYNLVGMKFNGKPSLPGIYINNGKKVVIK